MQSSKLLDQGSFWSSHGVALTVPLQGLLDLLVSYFVFVLPPHIPVTPLLGHQISPFVCFLPSLHTIVCQLKRLIFPIAKFVYSDEKRRGGHHMGPTHVTARINLKAMVQNKFLRGTVSESFVRKQALTLFLWCRSDLFSRQSQNLWSNTVFSTVMLLVKTEKIGVCQEEMRRRKGLTNTVIMMSMRVNKYQQLDKDGAPTERNCWP